MAWESAVVDALRANDVTTVACLTDSAIAPLIDRVHADDAFTVVDVTREEQAVGVASGAWLGGERAAVLCQSSGFATAINAIASLSKPARIPFLGLVTRRGDRSEFNLAQVPFGYAMPAVLDDLGIRNDTLDGDADVEAVVDGAAKTAFATQEPYVLGLDASLFGAKDEF